MTAEKTPKRYWGVITFAVLWSFGSITANAIDGSGSGANVGAVMWFWVAYYAYRGNVEGIRVLALIVTILQAIVGIGFYVYLTGDEAIQAIAGMTPGVLLFSLGIPTFAWFCLFLWARKTLAEMPQEDSHADEKERDRQRVAAEQARSTTRSSQPVQSATLMAPVHIPPADPYGTKGEGSGGQIATADLRVAAQSASVSRQISQEEKAARSMPADVQPQQDSKPVTPPVTAYAKARTVIEYSDDAQRHWESLRTLPKEYQEMFLGLLDASPKGDPRVMHDEVRAAHKAKTRPYADEAANDALEQMRTLSAQAEAEFRRVYDLLGNTVPVEDMVAKIRKKLAPPPPAVKPAAIPEAMQGNSTDKTAPEDGGIHYDDSKERFGVAVVFIAVVVAVLFLATLLS